MVRLLYLPALWVTFAFCANASLSTSGFAKSEATSFFVFNKTFNGHLNKYSRNQISFELPREFEALRYSISNRVILKLAYRESFSLRGVNVAINGVRGNHPYFFDIENVSHWREKENKAILYIDLTDLRFFGNYSIHREFRKICRQKGRLTIQLSNTLPILYGKLNFRNSPIREKNPRVVIDSVSPQDKKICQGQVQFEFHSPDGAKRFECSLDHRPFKSCQSPTQYSVKRPGHHRFRVRAISFQGFVGPITSHNFHVYSSQAQMIITKTIPESYVTNETEKTITFQRGLKNENQKGFCRLDEGELFRCASPVTFTNLEEGIHTIEIHKEHGRSNCNSANHVFMIDKTPPLIEWVSTPKPFTNISDASFHVRTSEDSSFECQLDGLSLANCEKESSFSNLTDGNHQFVITAIDEAENRSEALAFNWKIDHTPPQIYFNPNPNQAITQLNNVSFSFWANEGTIFQCRLDGEEFSHCNSGISYSELSDGNHVFELKGEDLAENQSNVQFNWQIDSTKPSLDLKMVSPEVIPTSSHEAIFEFSSSESSTFRCVLNGQTVNSPCTSPLALSNISEGSQRLDLYGTDSASNESHASFDWVTDFTAPVISLGTISPSETSTFQRNIEINFQANENSNFYCDFDGSGLSRCSSPFTANSLIDGMHVLSVEAHDNAGLKSSQVSYSWEVGSYPTVNIEGITPPASQTTSDFITFEFSGNASVFHCALDGGAFVQCQSPMTYTALSNGSHTFEVKGHRFGVESTVEKHQWTVQKITTPVVTINSMSPSVSLTSVTSFSSSFSSQTGTSFLCSLDNGPYLNCQSPYSIQNLSEGNHSFSVKALNSGGESVPASHFWTVDSTPPVISLDSVTPLEAITASNVVIVQFSSSETVNYFCSMDGGLFAPCLSPYLQAVSEGSHSLEIYALDVAGNQSTSIQHSWVVDNTLPEIYLNSFVPTTTVTSLSSFTADFSSNESNVTFYCSLNGAIESVCFSPYSVSGLLPGSHTFSVRAVDQAGHESAILTHSWTIDPTPLVISNVSLSQITQTSAMISWNTNIPATSQLLYGTSSPQEQSTPVDSVLKTNHSIVITNLSRFTFYRVITESIDSDGRIVNSPEISFRTLR